MNLKNNKPSKHGHTFNLKTTTSSVGQIKEVDKMLENQRGKQGEKILEREGARKERGRMESIIFGKH